MMALSLKKGDKVDLTKGNKGLSKILVEIGWRGRAGGIPPDLDLSAFLLQENGKVKKDSDLVFYHQLVHPSRSVWSEGDDTGEEKDEDEGENKEEIHVVLSDIPSDYEKVALAATIYGAEEHRQNFGQVSDAYIRLVEESNGNELMRYDLAEDFSTETAVLVAELYRNGAEWNFSAIGQGFKGGLAALCKHFGIDAK
jgi:tellurium resistance protein TerD